MPLDYMANSIRVFLGTQMVCAQCHDHPFDRWSQKDFYQLAAFMSGMNTKRVTKDDVYPKITNKEKKNKGFEVIRQARGLFNILSYGVSGNGSGLIRLPKRLSVRRWQALSAHRSSRSFWSCSEHQNYSFKIPQSEAFKYRQ